MLGMLGNAKKKLNRTKDIRTLGEIGQKKTMRVAPWISRR